MMLFRKCVSGVRSLALAAVVTGLVPLWQSKTAEAQVSVGISVNFAPPALPVYEQPLCPGEGYLWTPGYWAWDPDYGDYYWVPGTWVLAPQYGYLWTPPWWGWNGVAFIFHEGYWGPRIGFYGGINYGYGYPGRGYYGGRWERDRFYYNRNVNNINVTQIHNVYNKTVINNVNVTRVSYNGGDGGVRERANRQEEAAFRERHVTAVAAQQQHIQEARSDRALRASDNRGKPPIAATDRPGQFRGNVVPAKEGRYNPPANRAGGNRPEGRVDNGRPENARPENNVNRAPATTARPDNRTETRKDRSDRPPNARGAENNNRPTYVHPGDVPKSNRPDRPPSSGNAKVDQKYSQRSDNLYKKQDQERQNLQKKQEQEHARAEQQRANDTRRQKMENQHQQQTQKMEQRQQQQQQKMQRQAPQPKPQPQPKQPPPKGQGEKPHGKGR